jgi:TusA-related sulfurtransferase
MSVDIAVKPNLTLDMTGSVCPGPLLAAKALLDGLADGQVLLLVSNCPGTQDDLFAWARYTEHQVLKTERLAGGAVGFYIEKGKPRRRAAHAVLDIRGVACPGPIVEAKKLLNGMHPGEVLRVVSNCPGIRTDMAAWAKATAVKLLDTVESAPGEYEFYLTKG